MKRSLPAVIALVLFGLAGIASAQQGPAQVKVDAVIAEPFVQSSPVLGRLVSKEEGVVAARVAGPVAEIAVAVGDRVNEGDALARLDLTRLMLERAMADADLDAAQSELATATAQLELLAQERRRLEKLKGSAAFSAARLDDKQQEIIVAQSRIASARARLVRAEMAASYRRADIEDAVLRAPYPGVVVRKLASAGAYVRVGDPVVELVNNQDVEIEADVPTELMAGLDFETPVTFDLAGTVIDARVRAVIPVESAMTRTQAVRFALATDAPAGAIGGSVTVNIPTGSERIVVSVHKDAVLVRQGGRSVFKIDKENKAVPQPIQIGAAVGGRFEVTEGLEPGDLVVVRGNERLRPGQEVAFGEQPRQEGDAKPTAGSATEGGEAGRS